MTSNYILPGNNTDTLKTLPDNSVHCCITSPPYYGLRDYGVTDQIGLEKTPVEYIEKLVAVFHEVKRVLRDDGTLWVVIGDCYAGNRSDGGRDYIKPCGSIDQFTKRNNEKRIKRGAGSVKPKNLIGIPWRLAFALQDDGWYLRDEIIWYKPNPMPQSVKDRCTASHEKIFMLSKSRNYYFDSKFNKERAVQSTTGKWTSFKREKSKRAIDGLCPGKTATHREKREEVRYDGEYRNRHNVWTIATEASELRHFAMFPQNLVLRCMLPGCPENGIVLDPFMGAGTTAVVAIKNLRNYIGCEINPEYIKIAEARIAQEKGLFNE
jgi:DNA modification methylase